VYLIISAATEDHDTSPPDETLDRLRQRRDALLIQLEAGDRPEMVAGPQAIGEPRTLSGPQTVGGPQTISRPESSAGSPPR
jgi:hypothetical protein